MNEENLNIDAFNSVNYLFAKPYYEGHYYYALDDLNSMMMIDKDSLRHLLVKLGCGDFINTNYLLDRNLPFFYDVKKKQLKKFKTTNSNVTREDLADYIQNELKISFDEKEIKTPYEKFFGKDSDFYKNNFYELMENNYGNRKSI